MTKSTVIVKRVILCILTAFMICFIFYNSSFSAIDSDAQSFSVREFINSLLHTMHINITLSDFFVRKCAHFVEFFVLGTLLFFSVKSFVTKLDSRLLIAPFTGLVVAIIDEIIQLFSDGRSGQISDVFLDFIGVCFAVTIFFVITKFICKYPKDKEV